jgi:hypothetical protein
LNQKDKIDIIPLSQYFPPLIKIRYSKKNFASKNKISWAYRILYKNRKAMMEIINGF